MRFVSSNLLASSLGVSTFLALLALSAISGCGDDDGIGPMMDGGGMTADGGMSSDAMVAGDGGEMMGCNRLLSPVASPGDPIDGDTYDTFATGFFTTYCVRCHSTTLMGLDRNGAPDGRNWDDETSVRMFLPQMRSWVGEFNAMPLDDPKPTCEERLRFIRWIDADAP